MPGPVAAGVLCADADRVQRVPDGGGDRCFGGCDDNRPNCIPIAEGWNYAVRMYRPRTEIRDGSWTFPSITTI